MLYLSAAVNEQREAGMVDRGAIAFANADLVFSPPRIQRLA